MNISVVIPNYNGKELLEKNLPQVLAVMNKYSQKCEIIITDDSSKDASIEFLESFIKENKTRVVVSLLKNLTGKNKGFSENVNKGVRHTKGEVILLLNTDVVPNDDFLHPLVDHFQDKNVFAVGCMDESIENGEKILRGRGIGKWEKGFLMHEKGSINKATTLWVSGGSGAFRKSIWDRLGGLNELYNPFYWEDIDLSYRAQKAGFICLFEKKSIVRHEHEKGVIKKEYSSFNVRKVAYRNQFFFTWLNATDTIILAQQVLFLPYFFIKTFLNKDSAFLLGFLSALFLLPKVIRERKKVQALVKKSDKEVIQAIERN